jgi:hypothetical protein
MEKLIEKLKELIANETNIDVRIGLRSALLEAQVIYHDEIKESIKKFN